MIHTPEMPELPNMWDSELPYPALMTFEGEAGSGKGTCSEAVKGAAEELGLRVQLIDQGRKFRMLGLSALEQGVDLNDTDATDAFLVVPYLPAMLADRRSQIEKLTKDEQQGLLYNKAMNAASKQIGGRPYAHPTAIASLYAEVTQAAENETDLVIVDGRAMEKYGNLMHTAGLVNYILGFYFRCGDVSAGSHRSPEAFPKDFETNYQEMSIAQKAACFDAIMETRERNKADAQRSVDPMKEPVEGYRLDLDDFPDDDHVWADQFVKKAGIQMVSVVTTHNTIAQMTKPVVRLCLSALKYHDKITEDQIMQPSLR